jgi:MSHA biogenesis protein MshO
MRPRTVKQAGFTLVEMIVAMVVMAIVAATVAIFVRIPADNYRDAVARSALVDQADHALRLLARDVRLALPNSVRLNGSTTVTLLQTKTAGRYLDDSDGHASLQHLDFLNSATTSFTVIGDLPTGRQAISNGDYLVVNNLGTNVLPGDAYQTNGYNRAVITGTGSTAVAGTYTISLSSNPFASQVPPIPSPGSRFHVVSGQVSYSCTPGANGTGTLYRYSGTTINAAAPTGGTGALLASNVVSCTFTYTALNERMAMLSLSLTLQSADTPEGPITLNHQVHF